MDFFLTIVFFLLCVRFIAEFNETCEYLILTMFSYILLSICSSVWVFMSQIVEYFAQSHAFSSSISHRLILNFLLLLCFKKSNSTSTTSELLQPLLSVVWSFAIVFGICEFGERLTGRFDVFDATLWQCNWYSYPIELQRSLPILMANAQQIPFLKSYGNITCTRDSFKMVYTYAT